MGKGKRVYWYDFRSGCVCVCLRVVYGCGDDG